MQKALKNYSSPQKRGKYILIKHCLLLLLCVSINISSEAQDLKQKIQLSLDSVSIGQSIQEVVQKGKLQLSLREKLLEGQQKRISIHKEITVEEALEFILNGTGLQYKIVEGYVVIETAVIKGVVTGRVFDSDGNKALSGVSVKVKNGPAGTVTDLNGFFSINIPERGATLVISFIGYKEQEVTVLANSQNLRIILQSTSKVMDEVTVQSRRRANTEAAVLNERRRSATLQDAISAEQMERTASITTTQALQRVSGVTVTDDKYVAVRGLGDRSVIGQLNGIRLASSDPDRTTLPLDLIPSNLLDNITVFKNISPDKPADAAAGIVELKTKSIPDKESFTLTVQSGYNTQAGGKVNSFYNSDMGFFGQKVKNKGLSPAFNALATQYPNGLGEIHGKIANSRNDPALLDEVKRINNIMHEFDPVLTTKYKTAPVNQVYAATYGNNYQVFKKHQLGLILGANYYNRVNDIYDGQLTHWSLYQGALTGNPDINNPRVIPNYVTPNNINLGKYLNYKENTGTQTLNYGTLVGLAYRFNERHEVSVQYLGSWGAETKATNLYGAYEYIALPGGISNTVYSLKQTYRTLNTINVQGEHKLIKGDYSPKFSYNLASSSSTQEDPDFRFVNLADYKPRDGGMYTRPSDIPGTSGVGVPTNNLYSLVSGYVNGYGPYGIIQADPNGRRFRQLQEDNYNYKADLSVPFKLLGIKQEFKTGVNYLHRRRTYGENVLYLPGSNFSNTLAAPLYEVNGDLDRLVGFDRIGIHPQTAYNGEGQTRIGGYLYNTQKSPNNYKGYFETRAFYGMLDLRLTEQLRLTGGARFEMNDIQAVVDTANVFMDASITTTDASGNKVNLVYTEPNSIYKTKYRPFYSANLTYTLWNTMNLRLGYNNSVSRPELREITNVFDFDPFQFALVVGNPNLRNQTTTNYDFRWEWFPNSGEVISASVFYKQIDNQLTKVFTQKSEGLDARFPEFPAIEFQNDPNRGHVYGIELEVVKNLGLLWTPLSNFFLGSNLLLAQSDIKKTQERLESSRAIDRRSPSNSPLFEQAPYSINVYLNYTNRKSGSDFTTSFNMVGERLIQVNLDGTPDLYTRPIPVLDFVFTQRIYKGLQAKGFAKNILDRPYEEVYANPGTGGKFYGNKYTRRSFRRGAEIMIGLTYTF